MELFPPITERGAPHIDLYRGYRAESVVLRFPGGDSYELTPDSLIHYLKMIGSRVAEELVAYLWNFYSVRYFPKYDHFVWISFEEASGEATV